MKLYKQYKRPTVLHFDNKGKYGKDFKEIQIRYYDGRFNAIQTDGFHYCGIGKYFDSLKAAVTWGKVQLNEANHE